MGFSLLAWNALGIWTTPSKEMLTFHLIQCLWSNRCGTQLHLEIQIIIKPSFVEKDMEEDEALGFKSFLWDYIGINLMHIKWTMYLLYLYNLRVTYSPP